MAAGRYHVNSLGRGGVILFFLLSGYLIFRSVEREPTSTFLSRRMFKIFPAYSVNVALIFALGYFNSDHANWNLKLLPGQSVHGAGRVRPGTAERRLLDAADRNQVLRLSGVSISPAPRPRHGRHHGGIGCPQRGDLVDARLRQPAADVLSDLLCGHPDLSRPAQQLGPRRRPDFGRARSHWWRSACSCSTSTFRRGRRFT